MSWTTLKPAATTTGRPMISVYLRQTKVGLKLHFSFSSFLEEELGKPAKASVEVGADDNAGELKFTFGKTGDFDVHPISKGGIRCALPKVDGVPERDWGAEACTIVAKEIDKGGGGVLVVGLPIDIWSRASRPAPRPSVPEPPRMAGSAPEAPASSAACPARPLDAVEYLKGKGHTVARLAEGRWSLDGDTVVKGAIVKAVNKHRAKAGLDPLTGESVS